MESEVRFRGGLGAQECPDLAALCHRQGPFVSCYVDTQAGTPDAPHRVEIRWKDLRRELDEAGADEATLAAVEGVLSQGRRLGEAAGIVAAGGTMLVVDGAEEPLGADVARWGPLPSLGPLIAWRQHRIPYVTVACDRAGADITAVGDGDPVVATAGDADRHDPELHKVHGGGWAHRRYQQRVENAWDRHAREVVAELEEVAGRVSPRVVLYGGDPKACALIEEHASPSLRPLLERAPMTRASDGSDRQAEHHLRRALETVVAADTARLLAQLSELDAKSLGVEGAPLVLQSLTAAQVGVLLVHDDPADERTAFFSREPFGVSSDPATIEAIGGRPEKGRLVDVAIHGAFCTGATVRMAPAAPMQDGIAALLRFAA